MSDSSRLLLWTAPGDQALAGSLARLNMPLDIVHDADAATARLGEADGLILSAAHLSSRLVERIASDAKRLRWLHLTNAGYDNVLGSQLPNGLRITYTPGAGADTVAEHGVALMLALARRIPQSLDNQRAARWDYGVGAGTASLQGRTALVLGFGHIGQALAKLLRAFGMRIVAANRSGTAQPLADLTVRFDQVETLLPASDFVVVAAPLTSQTANFLDAGRLSLFPRRACLVNLSRGAIVDSIALAGLLADGAIAGAALDVTDPEPLPAGHPLWAAPNLLITPHTAATGSTPSDCARLIEITTENARRFSRGEPLLHIVDCSLRQAA